MVKVLTRFWALGSFPPSRYLFGETVQGTAYVVFGVKLNQEQIRLPSVKQVSDVSSTSTSFAD